MITAVIVTYNSQSEISDCIDSLLQCQEISNITIVDNASSDRTPDILLQYQSNSKIVNVKLLDQNHGLAAANNYGACEASSRYICFINPDTIVYPNTFQELIKAADSCDVNVVAPINLDEYDVPHSSFHKQWSLAHAIAWRCIPYKLISLLYHPFRTYSSNQTVGFVSGSCILIRLTIFRQVGGYDDKFFLAIEDVADLCKRISDFTNRKPLLVSSSFIKHLRGKSHDSAKLIVLSNSFLGGLHYQQKHYGRLNSIIFKSFMLGNYLSRFAFYKLKRSALVAATYRKLINLCISL